MTLKTVLRVIAIGLVLGGPILAAASDADVFKARREALMEKLDGGVAILYGSNNSSGIVKGGFVQESSFYYLTGVSEPGAALILAPGERRYQEILYLQPRNPEIEDWDGRREPLGEAQARVPGTSLENMAELIPEMRRIKDAREVEKIQKAVDITGKGIVAAMKAVEPGQLEFQLQSVVEHAYEMEGAQFLGLDVHDAGNYDLPLKAGVVITVEPASIYPRKALAFGSRTTFS